MLALMNMTDVRPITIGRSRGEIKSAMMVCAIGNRPPPPTPCSPRARISIQMSCASAQTTEPAMKIPIAVSRIVRRP